MFKAALNIQKAWADPKNTACKGVHPYLLLNRGLRSNIRRNDPTSTSVLRGQFAAQMGKRFRKLKGDIRRTIVDNDYFGVRSTNVVVLQPAERPFSYTYTQEKIDGFMGWLREQQDREVLEVIQRPGFGRGFGHTGPSQVPWTDTYIQSAYQKGIAWARTELRKEGAQIPSFQGIPGVVDEIGVAFNQPFHAERAGILFSRTFNELKGITETMDQQISRELSQGLIEGRGPAEIARRINDRVDKVGITRARLLARTEITHSHQVAALNEYELAENIINKKIKVQWFTAQDGRVRPTHQDRQGKIYTKREAQQLIGEPNCRCALLPYIPEWHEQEEQPQAVIEPTDKGFFSKPEYKQKYDDYRNLYSGLKAKDLRNAMKNHCPNIYRTLDYWQGSAQGRESFALKYLAQEIEGKKLQAFTRRNYDKETLERVFAGKKDTWVDEYLRIRAMTQEYYKDRKFVYLYRGTDGGTTGPAFKEKCLKTVKDAQKRGWNPDNVHVKIKENALVGYTDDPDVAHGFGWDRNGVTARLKIPTEDVFISHSNWKKEGYIREREHIVLGSPDTKVLLKNCNFYPQGRKWSK